MREEGEEQQADSDESEVGMASVRTQDAKGEKPLLSASPGLGQWLDQVGGSLAFSTYQTSRIFFAFSHGDGATKFQERIVGSAMGLAACGKGLWVSNKEQAWRFSDVGPRTIADSAFDAVYMPRKGYFLGPCDTHDLLADVVFQDERHELLFVNTNFSCIAAIDDQHSFRPVWKPDFISVVGRGDRCHLNGMGAVDGELAYATLCGRSDAPMGWREVKSGGGVVMDVRSGAILAEGLSMPHSPRWHDGRLWLLNSGEGELGYLEGDRFVSVAFCPGFARGLCFVGGMAVVGVSLLRANTFSSGLAIKTRLQERGLREFCGLLVIDPATGQTVHWLTITGVVTELYDVAFLPGIRNPFTPGFSHPQLHRALISIADSPLPVAPPITVLPTTPPAPETPS